MKRIIPYIIFYVIAAVVFAVMSLLSGWIMRCLFIIGGQEPTWIVTYLSVVIGVMSALLFIVEEK